MTMENNEKVIQYRDNQYNTADKKIIFQMKKSMSNVVSDLNNVINADILKQIDDLSVKMSYDIGFSSGVKYITEADTTPKPDDGSTTELPSIDTIPDIINDAEPEVEPTIPSDEVLKTTRDEGYHQGYEVGLEEGTKAGYDDGFSKGKEEGFKEGVEEGRKQIIELIRETYKTNADSILTALNLK